MMTADEILAKLRRIYLDGARDWDTNYDAYMADLEKRIGGLSVALAKLTGRAVSTSTPTGDVHYYSIEAPINAPADRFRIAEDDVLASSGESVYLVAYCSTIVPLVELRWHSIKLDAQQKRIRKSYDVLDDAWLSTHPNELELSLRVVEAAEQCGWQVASPDTTEQPPPRDWPLPLPSYDYQNGAYLIRDYIIKGMRDY
jgi:hypothetical protein